MVKHQAEERREGAGGREAGFLQASAGFNRSPLLIEAIEARSDAAPANAIVFAVFVTPSQTDSGAMLNRDLWRSLVIQQSVTLRVCSHPALPFEGCATLPKRL